MNISIYYILILLLVGLSLMLAETIICSYGTLALPGLIIFAWGIAMLANHHLLTLQTAWLILVAIAIINILFLLLSLMMAIKAKNRKLVSGLETLIGQAAIVSSDFEHHQGWVLAQGELWQAQGKYNFKKGSAVQIKQIQGLKLIVQ